MRVIGYRNQRTLAAPAEIEGVGFITGARVRVRLHPAPINTGVVFHRTDSADCSNIPARTAFVTGTVRRTTLGPPAQGVTLVEHLLAALAGLRVDNCTIEIDGPEPPGLDGSARGFVEAIVAAGIVPQPAPRPIWTATEPVIVSAGGATIGLHPASDDRSGLRISYVLDYGMVGPIPRQSVTFDCRVDEFVRAVAGCRTFVTEAEAAALRAQGVGRHLTPADLLVFGPRGVIDNRVRFADEPARHKILDLVGDLALCGFDLAGHVVAYRSGHALNVELARRLTELADHAAPEHGCLPFRAAFGPRAGGVTVFAENSQLTILIGHRPSNVMSRLKMAVIGVGHLGQHHARIIAELPDVELVGVADANPEQARTIAERLKTAPFESFEPLIGQVDAVCVVTPTIHHHRVAAEFLRAGIPALVEKPVCRTVAEADELIALAAKRASPFRSATSNALIPPLKSWSNGRSAPSL